MNSEQWSHLGGGRFEQVTGLSERVVLGDNVARACPASEQATYLIELIKP